MFARSKTLQNNVSLLQIGVLGSTAFPASTRSCSLLSQFAPQRHEGSERQPAVGRNEAAISMRKEFDRLVQKYPHFDKNPGVFYLECLPYARALRYSPSDVTAFCNGLSKAIPSGSVKKMAGLFISALVNSCDANERFTLLLDGLPFAVDYLGYRNTKDIEVIGNLGGQVAEGMAGGSLAIRGDILSGEIGRFMDGGSVSVHGRVFGTVGAKLKNGSIAVIGDVDGPVGFDMKDGKISVNGDVGRNAAKVANPSIGRTNGGSIIIAGDVYHGIGCIEGELTVTGNVRPYLHNNRETAIESGVSGAITVNGDVLGNINGPWGGMAREEGQPDCAGKGVISVNGNIHSVSISKEMASFVIYQRGQVFQHGRQLVKDGKKINEPENK